MILSTNVKLGYFLFKQQATSSSVLANINKQWLTLFWLETGKGSENVRKTLEDLEDNFNTAQNAKKNHIPQARRIPQYRDSRIVQYRNTANPSVSLLNHAEKSGKSLACSPPLE